MILFLDTWTRDYHVSIQYFEEWRFVIYLSPNHATGRYLLISFQGLFALNTKSHSALQQKLVLTSTFFNPMEERNDLLMTVSLRMRLIQQESSISFLVIKIHVML